MWCPNPSVFWFNWLRTWTVHPALWTIKVNNSFRKYDFLLIWRVLVLNCYVDIFQFYFFKYWKLTDRSNGFLWMLNLLNDWASMTTNRRVRSCDGLHHEGHHLLGKILSFLDAQYCSSINEALDELLVKLTINNDIKSLFKLTCRYLSFTCMISSPLSFHPMSLFVCWNLRAFTTKDLSFRYWS